MSGLWANAAAMAAVLCPDLAAVQGFTWLYRAAWATQLQDGPFSLSILQQRAAILLRTFLGHIPVPLPLR